MRHESTHLEAHVCAFAISALFAAILAASTFSREREQQTMDILFSIRLSGRSIVLGTFRGLWKSVLPFAAILVAVLLAGMWFTGGRIGVMLPLLNIAVYFSLILALGMRMSLTKSSVGKAIGWTLGILLAIAILPFILGYGMGDSVSAVSPAYWIAEAPNARVTFEDYYGGDLGYICNTTLYVVVTVVLLIRMIRRFDRTVRRQS